MKISGGEWRGRRLQPAVGPGIRPTAARVREALFSMVGQDLAGWTVLDVFGGSGLLSFEALSRGAESAFILEANARAAEQIRLRAARLGAGDRVRVLHGRAPAALPTAGSFDLVLLDPPYELDPGPTLAAVAPVVSGVLVLEQASTRALPANVAGLLEDRQRAYGDTRLVLYRSG